MKNDLRNKLPILQAPCVVKFVDAALHPIPIPDEQINWVKTLIGHLDRIRRKAYIREGGRIRVMAGPLIGRKGMY